MDSAIFNAFFVTSTCFFLAHVNSATDSSSCNQPIDLAFAVDSSYSVGVTNFEESLGLVKAVSSRLDIGTDKVQVALVQFSNVARVEFSLREATSIDDVVRRLDGVNYTEGNTQTGAALNLLREDVFTAAHGDRPGVPNLAVIITDGASSDHHTLMNESSLLEQSDLTVLAVSVGFVTHPDELRAMAGREILRVNSYAELVALADEVVRLVCSTTLTTNQADNTVSSTTSNSLTAAPSSSRGATSTHELASTKQPVPSTTPATPVFVSQIDLLSTELSMLYSTSQQQVSSVSLSDCQGRAVDIVIVVDSSNSVGVDNFHKIQTFLVSLVDSLDTGPATTRVGIIIFSDDATMVVRLEDTTNKTNLKSAILNIQYTGGGTNTAAALKLLSSTVFSRPTRHSNIPQVAVVLTDGLSSNTMVTKIQAEHLHAMGVKLFAIGIGNKASIEELEIIGSKPSAQFVIAMSSFNNLSSYGANFVASACKAFPRWSDLIVTSGSPSVSVTGASVEPSQRITPAVEVNLGDEQCFDVHENCHGFGRDVCSDFEQWARAHCAATCKFCARNVSDEICEDSITNCKDYGTYVCENPFYLKWAWENCAAHCGLCEASNGIQTTKSTPLNETTHPSVAETFPEPTSFLDPDCSDTISDCANYGGHSACVDYHAWASVRCREFCGFCSRFVVVNATVVNGIRCPEWKLPVECTMDYSNKTCCPIPSCPDGFVLTAKREN
ncbi:hypothetical protein RRG08_017031 [Elysia crispata]|uniref:Uncharacterized protein n=1 Tax=Elysia crispata TaxID=231223 RepID=A0AAE1CPJ4_9GAST|nr:hypothetical protein RRG08_017031 [Elysia crispata]